MVVVHNNQQLELLFKLQLMIRRLSLCIHSYTTSFLSLSHLSIVQFI